MEELFGSKKLKQELDKFPSSFDLDLTKLIKDRVISTIKKLSSDRENTTKLDAEDIKISNFLSYLNFLLGDNEQALQLTDESLQKDPDNIIANANKARLLLESGDDSDVEDILIKLQALERTADYAKRKCHAESDLAYAYSRSGPWYHKKAIDIYERIVQKYPTEYTWKFGLGLTLQRTTHLLISQADAKFDSKQNEKTTEYVVELLHDVATKTDDSIMKAKAYAQLGKAVYNIEKNALKNMKALESKTYFEKAIEISPEEPLVLQICGQYARYRGDLEKSVELLRKSIKIYPTCSGYHHLALTLKRKTEMRQPGRYFTAGNHLRTGQYNDTADTNPHSQRHHQTRYRNRSGNGRGQVNPGRYQHSPRFNNHSASYSPGIPYGSYCDEYGSYGQCHRSWGMGAYVNVNYGWNGNGNGQFQGYWDSNGNQTPSYNHVRRSDVGRNKRGSGRFHQSKGSVQGRRSQESDQSERKRRQNLQQAIKSPLKVAVYPGNELLVEAIELLEKTEELDPHALNIQYDKGIIYRMLGQIEEAVQVFKTIVSKRKLISTETQMTNVFEQLGLCLLEMSEMEETSPDGKIKYKKDGQTHLSNAFEIQWQAAAKDPKFKEAWNSYSTLQELLSDKHNRKPRQLAILHKLMGNHTDSIDIYRELMKEKGQMKPDDCKHMIECHQKEKQFEECVTLLKTWECTEFLQCLPSSLIFDVYIDGALHAYTTDNAQIAYSRFRRAFQEYRMFDRVTYQSEEEEDEDTKDILILHSCPCKLPRNIGRILEECTGLRCTVNTEDLLGNAIILEAMVSIMQRIPCIAIMTHGSAKEYDPLYVDHALQINSKSPKVLVVSDEKRNVPDVANTTPFIRMPSLLEGAMEPGNKIPEVHREWVKEFITLMKPE